MERLVVWREISGCYERVGTIGVDDGSVSFSYAPEYLSDPSARAISASLPLEDGVFGADRAARFFDGLLPEGSLRKSLELALRVPRGDVGSLLAGLSDESSGALLFSLPEESPAERRRYEPAGDDLLALFAESPRSTALELGMASRLSLAGAQSKIGLMHEGDDIATGWMVPYGTASSTHILKASDGTFPGLSVNEAVCMRAAEALGFDVARCDLIPVDGHEPILAVRRFDRVVDPSSPFPLRLHQEDFCQALGFDPYLKYEPTGADYPELCGRLVSDISDNPFGDRMCLMEALLLDVLLGNCDNHLKNFSMLLDAGWRSWELAPLYDVTCTMFYPGLDLEMGISLCPSRKVDDTTWDSVVSHAAGMGLPAEPLRTEFIEMACGVLGAIEESGDCLAAEGFPEAREMAGRIVACRKDTVERLEREARAWRKPPRPGRQGRGAEWRG